MTPGELIDSVVPFRGPCGLCGGPDQRHRVFDAIVDRVTAGESVEAASDDYGYSPEFVLTLVEYWPSMYREGT